MRPWTEQRHPWNRSAALCVPLVAALSSSQMVDVDSNIDRSIDAIDALTGLRECMNILLMCCLQMPPWSSRFIQIPSCFSKEFESIKNHLYFHDPQHDNPFLTSVTSFSTPLARTAKVPKADGCIDSCCMAGMAWRLSMASLVATRVAWWMTNGLPGWTLAV